MPKCHYVNFNSCSGKISLPCFGELPPSAIEISKEMATNFHNYPNQPDYIVSRDVEQLILTPKARGNITAPLNTSLIATLTNVEHTALHKTELAVTYYLYLDRLSVTIGNLLHSFWADVKFSDAKQEAKIQFYCKGKLLQEIAVDMIALMKERTLSFDVPPLEDTNGRVNFIIFGVNEAQIRYSYQTAEVVDHSPGALCPIQNLGSTLYQHPRVKITDIGDTRSIIIDLDQAKIYRPTNGLLKIFFTKIDDPFYIYEQQIIDIEKILSARKGKRQHPIKTKLTSFSIYSEPLFVE